MAFELLVSGDAVVPDHDAAVARCAHEWGLPPVHPNWTAAPPGAGGKWSFARLQRDRRLAPTAFEILGIPYHAPDPSQRPDGYAYLPEIAAAQGLRPVRNHSTVVSARDLDAVAEQLASSGGRYRIDPPDANLPFPRLWVGFSSDDPGQYQPGTDGGLRIEVLPHGALNMPAPDSPADPVPLGDGTPVRVVARTFVVQTLGPVLEALERHLGWQPDTTATGADALRRARFDFAYPGSAALELVQADQAGAEGDFLGQWGPGPFSVRIAVRGLGSLRSRLDANGVAHYDLPPAAGDDRPRLYRPPEFELGTAFEFVEDDPSAGSGAG